MTLAYRSLNGLSLLLAVLALLSLAYPSLNPFAVDCVGTKFANITAPCGRFFAYLVFSVAASTFSLVAFWIYPIEFETPRFPFYCLGLTWAPLLFLAALGCILTASGKLFW